MLRALTTVDNKHNQVETSQTDLAKKTHFVHLSQRKLPKCASDISTHLEAAAEQTQ